MNTQVHWCSGYPQFIMNNIKYRRQDFTWCSGYPQRSSWGVPTASDELYSCLCWHPWVESKLSGMGIRPQDQPDDISSAQPIWLQLGRYDLMQSEPWHQASFCFLSPWEIVSTAYKLHRYLQSFVAFSNGHHDGVCVCVCKVRDRSGSWSLSLIYGALDRYEGCICVRIGVYA